MKKANKLFKSITVLALIVSFVFVNIQNVFSANYSYSISASKTIVSPGEIISLNLSGSGLEGSFRVSVTGDAQVKGKNPIWTGESTSIKAGSSSFTITVTPESVADDSNGSIITDQLKSKSILIQVQASGEFGGNDGNDGNGDNNSGNTGDNTNHYTSQKPSSEGENLSANADLKSLTVSKGTLTPSFSADVTDYQLDLAASVTSVEVSAKANDSKASVSGTGEKELTPGENKIEVIVTAENKSTKTYTITAIVDEKPLTFVKYNDSELGVVRNLSGVKAPDGFEETMITIDGKDVKAWKSNNMNITIVYLIDEKTSEKNFYMYDVKENKVLSIFKPTAILGNNLFIVDIDKEHQKKNGFKYEKVKVDNVELMGWTFEDKAFKDYSLIYVMNEQGKMQYYLYEKTQNTLQLYSDAAPITQKAYDKLTNDFKHSEALKLTFMVLTGILTISTIISVITSLKLRSKRERDWFR